MRALTEYSIKNNMSQFLEEILKLLGCWNEMLPLPQLMAFL